MTVGLLESLKPIERGEAELTREQCCRWLRVKDPELLEHLYRAAYKVKCREVGPVVQLRGLIEISNYCLRDCLYCGIRKSNAKTRRYALSIDEIVESAGVAASFRYGSIVLQGGERNDKEFTDYITEVLKAIKQSYPELGITLSLGEQSQEVYQQWFEAGAHRYLLRIESSNPELFRKIHPMEQSWASRRKALEYIRAAGYQVGTGAMSALPYQATEDMVSDLFFYKELSVDMIGMGPYIPHHDTPMGRDPESYRYTKLERLRMGLTMIALTRLLLRDVNIASTTALQALATDGRERGLLAGGNVVMPNVTRVKYRSGYQLYEGKPGIDENSDASRASLERAVEAIGETLGYGQWGDSPHFAHRKAMEQG